MSAQSKQAISDFKKRLAAFKRRKFKPYGYSSKYAAELAEALQGLEGAEDDPKGAITALLAFFTADQIILNQCDDSNGSIGDVFRINAADLFVRFATRCDDKQWIIEQLLPLLDNEPFDFRCMLFKDMAVFMPEPIMRQAVTRLWELFELNGRNDLSSFIFALEYLAWQLKDPALLIEVISCKNATRRTGHDLPVAYIIDIALLYFQCDDLANARSWIERIPVTESFKKKERDALMAAIYKKLGDTEALTQTMWRMYRADRGLDSLNRLIAVVGESEREGIVKQAIADIMRGKEFKGEDAHYLFELGRIDYVERYIIKHAKNIEGDFYWIPLNLIDDLKPHNKPLATSVLYRALLDSILVRAKSVIYHHGVSYLKKLEKLAPTISDWQGLPDHTAYFAAVRVQHKQKSSFWRQYEGK
jgi:hypothetical protein